MADQLEIRLKLSRAQHRQVMHAFDDFIVAHIDRGNVDEIKQARRSFVSLLTRRRRAKWRLVK